MFHIQNRPSALRTSRRAKLGPSLAMTLLFILPAATAWADTIDFDSLGNGTLLTSQLSASTGVTFPLGVEIVSSGASRSAPNLARAQFDGEFARDRFVADFASGQDSVTVYVKREPGQAQVATVRAYSASSFVLDSAAVTLSSDSTWYQLTVTDGFGSIRSVDVTATQGSFETNFYYVDDLTYSGAEPPPPTDTTDPTVAITDPAFNGVTFTTPAIPIAANASDNTDILTFDGFVRHVASDTVVALLDFCGTPFSGVCSNPHNDGTTASLSPAIEGLHEIFVEACDSAGNCDDATRNFEFEPAAPPADVTFRKVEVNQGVQAGLVDVGLPGDNRSAGAAVRMQGGRNTVVRFYPLADGSDRPDYTARMWIEIHNEDGSSLVRRLSPNTGTPSILVVAEPSSGAAVDEELREMRRDPARTLNYVVPGSLLENATGFDVRIEEGTSPSTGLIRVGFSPKLRLAIRDFRIIGSAVSDGTGYPTNAQLDTIYEYVEAVYPVSEVIRIGPIFHNLSEDPVCEFFAGIGTDSPGLACALWQFSGHSPSTPPISLTDDPTFEVFLGQIPYGAFGRVGMAMGRHNLSIGRSDSAYAHETGHNAGRPHADNAHGEAGAEAWPHPHGTMGALNFGAYMTQTAPSDGFNFGAWDLIVVDPCPVPLASAGANCAGQMDPVPTHDFMSYGDSSGDLGPLNDRSMSRNWISTRNWNAIYNHIQANGRTSSSVTSEEHLQLTGATVRQEADAMRVSAVVGSSGEVRVLPVLRRSGPATAARATAAAEGETYELQVLGAGGEVLQQVSTTSLEMFDAGSDPIYMIDETLPYEEDMASVRIRQGGQTLATSEASQNAPVVQVLSPNGGEVFTSGQVTLSWTRSDADGDGVLSQIQYSADGGASWTDLGVVGSQDPAQLVLDVGDLASSSNALFRVLGSDGLLTAEDTSDCTFAVGVAEADACSPTEPPVQASCVPDANSLCLSGDRFRVEMDYRTAGGDTGQGRAVPLAGGDSGYFWFFDSQNVEALVKVLDGCVINQHQWVYSAGLTDVEVTMTVTDTETDEVKTYVNPLGSRYQPITDVMAFSACDAAANRIDVDVSSVVSTTEAVTELGLQGGRFEVTIDWRAPNGDTGQGQAIPLTGDTGYFWFFSEDNAEVVVKVLDACSFTGTYWLYAGGLTDVEMTLTVTDKVADQSKVFTNAQGNTFEPIADTEAFETCSAR